MDLSFASTTSLEYFPEEVVHLVYAINKPDASATVVFSMDEVSDESARL